MDKDKNTNTNEYYEKILEQLIKEYEDSEIKNLCIECGVDVDFPSGYRQNCFLSSIYQAAGRINRNGFRNAYDSALTVFELKDERHDELMEYGISKSKDYILFEDITNPDVISKYFKEMFNDLRIEKN